MLVRIKLLNLFSLSLLFLIAGCAEIESTPEYVVGADGQGLVIYNQASLNSEKLLDLNANIVVKVTDLVTNSDQTFFAVTTSAPWLIQSNSVGRKIEGFVPVELTKPIDERALVLTYLEENFEVQEDKVKGRRIFKHPFVNAQELRAVPYLVEDFSKNTVELWLYLDRASSWADLALPRYKKWVAEADGERVELWEMGIGQALSDLSDELETLNSADPDLAYLRRVSKPIADYRLSAFWEWNKLARIAQADEATYFASIELDGREIVVDQLVSAEQKAAMLITLQAFQALCECRVDLAESESTGPHGASDEALNERDIAEALYSAATDDEMAEIGVRRAEGFTSRELAPGEPEPLKGIFELTSEGWCCARVVGVEDWDVLNVRLAPDANAQKIGSLNYNAREIGVFQCQGTHNRESLFSETEAGRRVRGTWCLIGDSVAPEAAQTLGWVNAFYLAAVSS